MKILRRKSSKSYFPTTYYHLTCDINRNPSLFMVTDINDKKKYYSENYLIDIKY